MPKLVQFERQAIDAAVAASALALEATPRDRWICCLPARARRRAARAAARRPARRSGERAPRVRSAGESAPSRTPRSSRSSRRCSCRLLGADDRPHRIPRRSWSAALTFHRTSASARTRVGAPVIETYGLTESCGGVVYDGLAAARDRDAHRRERWDRAARSDAHARLPLRRSGHRCRVHRGRVAPARATPGRSIAAGRLHVVGRIDDLINTGGEKVWPHEVEVALRDAPEGRGGRRRRASGPRVGAARRRLGRPGRRGGPSDARGASRRSRRPASPRHKCPRELVLVDELPRTFIGKLRRGCPCTGVDRNRLRLSSVGDCDDHDRDNATS